MTMRESQSLVELVWEGPRREAVVGGLDHGALNVRKRLHASLIAMTHEWEAPGVKCMVVHDKGTLIGAYGHRGWEGWGVGGESRAVQAMRHRVQDALWEAL